MVDKTINNYLTSIKQVRELHELSVISCYNYIMDQIEKEDNYADSWIELDITLYQICSSIPSESGDPNKELYKKTVERLMDEVIKRFNKNKYIVTYKGYTVTIKKNKVSESKSESESESSPRWWNVKWKTTK